MNGENKMSSGSLIGVMREATWTLRAIASVVIITFGGLVTSPAVAAVAQEVQKIQWHKADSGNAAKLSAKLDEAHKLLTRFSSGGVKTAATTDISDRHAQIHGLMADLTSLDKGAMDDFATTETHIKDHHLPAVIEQRQQAAVKTYRSRMDALMTELKAADAAKDAPTFQAHISKAKDQLDQNQVKPFHQKFDPNHLPFSVAKPTTQKPRLTKKDYQAHPVAPLKRVQVAANGSLAGIVTAATLGATVPTNPSDPSYVAPTDDVQITPAIQAEATALNNDPVQIYNWVHNNIEYVPTYGSIQGSDMTLQTLKGNDFDQASLLIALLRASNIPARYVYGTIQVPIAQVENWVGGVTDPNAALNLLGQGGVPVNAVVQGGQIKYAQLEHVWVEAWVNFIPSRAAKSGPGNTWAPMDASFKQYAYTQGMNLQQSVPFDGAGLANHIVSTTPISSSQGTIGNVDAGYIQLQLQSYQSNVSGYITSQNSSASWADIFGNKDIVSIDQSGLSASLPYQVDAIGTRSVEIPASLRWQYQLTLLDQYSNRILNYSVSTPSLAGKKLSVAFQPATDADLNTAVSYLSAFVNSSSPSYADVPNSLPAYLINVSPVVYVNGALVATAGDMSLGSQLQISEGYWSPKDQWQDASSTLVAGEYHSIGFDLQGVPDSQIQSLQNTLSETDASLTAGTFSASNADSIIGDTLQAHILSYFAFNDSQDEFAQKIAGIVQYREPSFGTSKTTAKVVSNFGIPQSVSFPGMTMDVNWVKSILVQKAGNSSLVTPYYLVTGSRLSALENVVPELSSSTTTSPVNGVSAVKLIELAQQAGQQIYVIDSSNLSAALPMLNVGSDVAQDIEDSANAGYQILVPQNPVNYSGWSGTGYIITDPATGSSAYKISGGANGGFAGVLWGAFGSYCELIFKTIAGYHNLYPLEKATITVGKVILEKLLPFVDIGLIAYKCKANPAEAAIMVATYAICFAGLAMLFAGPLGALGLLLEVLCSCVVGQVIDFCENQDVAGGVC